MATPNCRKCGRFISWKRYAAYTPYGFGFEPPDDEYICASCLKKLDDQDWYYMSRAWLPIMVLVDDKPLVPCSCTGELYPMHDEDGNVIGTICTHCRHEYVGVMPEQVTA